MQMSCLLLTLLVEIAEISKIDDEIQMSYLWTW